VRNDSCRYLLAPTISYTQKLENRVRELEGLLEGRGGRGKGTGDGTGTGSGILEKSGEGREEVEGDGAESGVLENLKFEEKEKGKGMLMSHDGLGTFDGLKRDEKGGITYHGATSFFQLPSPVGRNPNERSGRGGGMHPGFLEAAGGGERKERLVNNAWQQRAMETFSETPVSS